MLDFTLTPIIIPGRHETPKGLHLVLELDGASPEDIARGIQAAQAVFQQADVSSFAAAVALSYQEAEDEDRPAMTDEQFAWPDVWRCAEEAAVLAACRDLPPGRKSYVFSQDWDDNPPSSETAHWLRCDFDWPGA